MACQHSWLIDHHVRHQTRWQEGKTDGQPQAKTGSVSFAEFTGRVFAHSRCVILVLTLTRRSYLQHSQANELKAKCVSLAHDLEM